MLALTGIDCEFISAGSARAMKESSGNAPCSLGDLSPIPVILAEEVKLAVISLALRLSSKDCIAFSCLWLIAGFCSIAPAHAEPHISASRILERFYRATGGDEWKLYEECDSAGSVTFSGKKGSLHTIENLRDGGNRAEVQIPDLGVKQADGNYVAEGWHQDADGDIQLSGSNDPSNVDDRYLTRRAYWQPNFGGAVVKMLSAESEGSESWDRLQFKVPGGRGFVLWINQKTGLLDRMESGDTKRFSDYRPVDGVLMPFVESKPAGNGEVVVNYSSRTLRKHIDQAAFAIPFRNDYGMPLSGEVTVAAEKGLTVKARVNGEGPFSTLFDTGSINIISKKLATRLGLKLEAEGVELGTSTPSNMQVHKTHVDTLQIGDLVVHNQSFVALDLPGVNEDSFGLVVGYELMRRLGVRVDYDHQRITFYDAARFRYSGAGTAVPIQFHGNYLVAQTAVGDAAGPFVLDTGNESGTFTNGGFTNANHLVETLSARFMGYNGRGYAGPSPEAYLARTDKFRIGDVVAPSTVIHLVIDQSDKRTEAGNIGQDVLSKFTEVFDCMHGVVYFEKSGRSSQPEVFNRAGLLFDSFGHGLQVMTVLPGSSGAEAGLRVGDNITDVDGKAPPDEVNPPAFLEPAGTAVHLSVRRADKALTMTVILRDVL
jgi:hypothetical protein